MVDIAPPFFCIAVYVVSGGEVARTYARVLVLALGSTRSDPRHSQPRSPSPAPVTTTAPLRMHVAAVRRVSTDRPVRFLCLFLFFSGLMLR